MGPVKAWVLTATWPSLGLITIVISRGVVLFLQLYTVVDGGITLALLYASTTLKLPLLTAPFKPSGGSK